MVASWSIQYQRSREYAITTASQDVKVSSTIKPEIDLFQVKLDLLETLRRSLVQAMKFGKMLVIRLGTSAPNFMKIFSDEALDIDNTKRGSAYFPLQVFERGGMFLHEPPITHSRAPSTSLKNQNNHSNNKNDSNDNGNYSGNNAINNFVKASGGTKELTWAERLFREEDMRPHKNVSFCRYGGITLKSTILY